jgi:hypothetical protein
MWFLLAEYNSEPVRFCRNHRCHWAMEARYLDNSSFFAGNVLPKDAPICPEYEERVNDEN